MASLGFLNERCLVGIDAIAPVVLAAPKPEPFGRVQFWGIRREKERRYSSWPLELLRDVPACSIEHHHLFTKKGRAA